jgi:hypothetical protein
MGVDGQLHAPAALPPGNTRYPLYRRLGGPQGRSGRVRKISSPPGFDPRNFHPVASRYTDSAIPAHTQTVIDGVYFIVSLRTGLLSHRKKFSARYMVSVFFLQLNLSYFLEESRGMLHFTRKRASYALKLRCSETR